MFIQGGGGAVADARGRGRTWTAAAAPLRREGRGSTLWTT